jgi:hypothetical protein
MMATCSSVFGALVATTVLAACGATASIHHKPAPPTVDGCVSLAPAARMITLDPAGSPPVQVVLLGRGKATFVLSNESDENLCSWLPFARTLEAHGYSAMLFDFVASPYLPAEAAAAAVAARAAGARHVILMGASVGGVASIQAAAARPPGLAAVVTLSAEPRLGPSDLRRVTSPTLMITASDDP